MLKSALIAAAGTLAIAAITTVVTGPEAAAAPKCLNKANKHVACTDKLRAKTPRRKGWGLNYGKIEMEEAKPR